MDIFTEAHSLHIIQALEAAGNLPHSAWGPSQDPGQGLF